MMRTLPPISLGLALSLSLSFPSASNAANLLGILSMPIEQRSRAFKAVKNEAYPFLNKIAFDRSLNLTLRWRAITSMGRLDSVYFKGPLEKALVSKEWFMRNAALIAIQTDDRAHAIQWSARLVADPALVVRTQAVRNLIQLDARETEALLWQQIYSPKNFHGHESLWVRVHLAEALAKFASAGRAKFFQRMLMDRDERLHKWAVLGLENTTGFKTSDKEVPIEIRRQEWLSRLGVQEI